jgi:predicted methyltransferase
MTRVNGFALLFYSAAVMAVAAPVLAQDSQADRMRAALASPERSDADKARDDIRRPIEVIGFLGIQEGDNVLELVAAGGWYTQVLSAAVGDDGQVYAQNPTFFLGREGFLERETALHDRLGNVTAVHGEVADAGIDGQMDAAITALNLHDIYNGGGEAAAMPLISGAFNALRSGGVLGVIDHRGIAGQPNADFHRMEQRAAEALLEAAGFIVAASSEILANPADDHMRGAGDESLGRNSDRFLIRGRKP